MNRLVFDRCLALLKKAKLFAHQQFSDTIGRTELLNAITEFEMDLTKEEENGRN